MLAKGRLDTTNSIYYHHSPTSTNLSIGVVPGGPSSDPLCLLSLLQITLMEDILAIPHRRDEKSVNLLSEGKWCAAEGSVVSGSV